VTADDFVVGGHGSGRDRHLITPWRRHFPAGDGSPWRAVRNRYTVHAGVTGRSCNPRRAMRVAFRRMNGWRRCC
jgi:hypothetical protein